MQSYDSIIDPFHYETVIQKSRFIADIFPITNEDEAREKLQQIRKLHYDATHHCSAFRLGSGQPLERSADDGEPAGTAGRPMLSVLQHRGLTNLIAIVTRYFGGIKLGTGGLVRAYGGTLAAALDRTPLYRFTPHRRCRFTVPYDLLGSIENEWRDRPIRIAHREFGADVVFTTDIPLDLVAEFATQATDLSAARIHIEMGETRHIPLPIINAATHQT